MLWLLDSEPGMARGVRKVVYGGVFVCMIPLECAEVLTKGTQIRPGFENGEHFVQYRHFSSFRTNHRLKRLHTSTFH